MLTSTVRRRLVLAVLFFLLATVLAVTLSSCGDDPVSTAITTEADPGFSLKPSSDFRYETEDGGKTIRIYVDEEKAVFDLNTLAIALKNFTVVDSSGTLLIDRVLRPTASGETFTVSYGTNKTIYRIFVYFNQYVSVRFEGFDKVFKVLKGTCAAKPQGTPSKEGYTFEGWQFDFSKPLTEDTAIGAIWKAKTFKITLDAKGGSLASDTITVTFGENVELPIPILAGSTFTGWFLQGEAVYSGIWTKIGDVTLMAKWDHFDYKITYDANGGTVDKLLQGVSYGESFEAPTPIRPGYAFVGWYCDGSPVYTSRYPFESDKTFVAHWEERTYQVNFEPNGGQPIPSGSYLYRELKDVIPVREGYTFGGWFFDDSLSALDAPGSISTVTVYAWWTEENRACDFTYEMSDKEATVISYHGSGSYCTVPTYIGGVPVTKIAAGAFSGSLLKSVKFSESLTEIGERAFADCVNLVSVNPTDSHTFDLKKVSTLGAYAFSGCALTNVSLPRSITHLPDGVFSLCTKLTAASLGTVISVGNDLFRGCSSLVNVLLPTALTSLGSGTFAECTSLVTLNLPTALSSIGNELFYHCTALETLSGYLTSTKITSIGAYAFSGCEKLATVGVPRSVKTIGAYAFENCKLLDSVSLVLVSVIEEGTFMGCEILQRVTVNTPIASIGDYAFRDCVALTSIALSDSLSSIGAYAFENCRHLLSVSLGAKLSSLGEGAFKGCASLVAVTIPARVLTIPESLFEGCSSLAELSWHNGITEIAKRAFADCQKLSLTYFPTACTYIGEEAFLSCISLEKIVLDKNVNDIADRAFKDCTSLTTVSFNGTMERFKGASYDTAFEGCDAFTTVEAVTWTIDDLRPSLTPNPATGALWYVDSSLSFNENRPAAVLLFREGSVFYRNLVKDGKVNGEYLWKLSINGSTSIIAQFSTTVDVSLFDVYDLGGFGYVMLDLGEGFASLQNVISCEVTLEIYGKNDPSKLLYQAYLDRVTFEQDASVLTPDTDRIDTNEVIGLTVNDRAKALFDNDLDTRYLASTKEEILLSAKGAFTLSSYSFITVKAQHAYPYAVPYKWTVYGGVKNAEGVMEWIVLDRVEEGGALLEDLTEFHFSVNAEDAYSSYKIVFEGSFSLTLAEIKLYQK